jgi:hypothetical protein
VKLRRVSLLVNLQLRQMYGDLIDAMAGRGREVMNAREIWADG